MDGSLQVPEPRSEPVRQYAPGSAERPTLERALHDLAAIEHELTMTIGGRQRAAGGPAIKVVQPHAHGEQLGTTWEATEADASAAVDAALSAAPLWRELSYAERAAVFLRAADLLSGPWRDTLNAATMLGQSKTVIQAEIDAACELADFWRFNAHYGQRILEDQPRSAPGSWNRMDHRPLEGFVLAVTPFNFTAIAGNLPTAPALMGNTVVWKPAPTQALAAHYTMRLLEAAGLPAGVVNLVTGTGPAVSRVALDHRDLAGVHFTGSTAVFRQMWQTVGANIGSYRAYPRIVGETGGKDFVVAHASADLDALRLGLVRGAFEYQGQKCSAASRAYIPRSLWSRLEGDLAQTVDALPMGDVRDFSNFLGAVIDAKAFARLQTLLEASRHDSALRIVAGGECDDRVGWFVRPTVVEVADGRHETVRTEHFGPYLSVIVYDDGDFEHALDEADAASPYALTGAVFAEDRDVLAHAQRRLRFAAGNLYLNDKPTGAVVGHQPFGGGRASGTNDKAGSVLNLLRWSSPRVTKENFVPPSDWQYPHMG